MVGCDVTTKGYMDFQLCNNSMTFVHLTVRDVLALVTAACVLCTLHLANVHCMYVANAVQGCVVCFPFVDVCRRVKMKADRYCK